MTINLMTPDGMHLKQLTEDNDTYRYDADWFDPVGRSVSPVANFVAIWGEIKKPTSARPMMRAVRLKHQHFFKKGGKDVIQS